jgi:xanthine phosphoribosyltransferase
MNTINITWERFHQDTRALIKQLPRGFASIIAVSRGGLVPATIIAHELNIRMIETLCIESYDENKQRGSLLHITKFPRLMPSPVLVVDDTISTGKTIESVQKVLTAHYAVVYAKPTETQFIDTFSVKVEQDTWLVFPWEKK